MIRVLYAVVIALLFTACQGGGSGDSTGLPDQQKPAIQEKEIENWVRIRLIGDAASRLSVLENFDAEKDAAIFCGRKDGEIRCGYYQAVVENTYKDAWGYTRGTIASRKIVSLKVPFAARAAQDITTKQSIDNVPYTEHYFCATASGQETCWFYSFDSYLSSDPDAPCARHLVTMILTRPLYMGVLWSTCSGSFVEQDSFRYHFYGTEHQEDQYNLRVERCSLDGRLDTSFENNGSALIYHPTFSANRVKAVTKIYNGYLIGASLNDVAYVARLDEHFEFDARFKFVRFEPGNYFPYEPRFANLSMNKDRTIAVTIEFPSRHGTDVFSGTIPAYGGTIEKLSGSTGSTCPN
jgi:hypothetical protein